LELCRVFDRVKPMASGGEMTERRNRARIVAGGAVMALMLLAAGLLIRPSLQAPAPRAEDWAAAADRIRDALAEGDLVRVEPFWSTGGRIWFGDLDGGSPTAFRLLDVHEPADPQWLTRAPRVWIVGAMGYGGDLAEELQALGYTIGLDEELGRVRLLRMDRGDLALRWEMVAALGEAVVDGVERRKVRRQVRRVAAGPRECLLLGEAGTDGAAEVALAWDGIEGSGTLWIRAGNTMDSARNRVTGDLTVTARAGGNEASLTVPEGSYSLEQLTLPFEGGALEVSVQSSEGGVHPVCLDGLLIGPPTN
jgi:hypothetical protein